MKKIICLVFFSLLVLIACNKDKKLNKSLDGTWLTTSMDGVSVTLADTPIQYKFSGTTKVGGTVFVTFYDNFAVDAEYVGTYKVSNDGKTITIDASSMNGSGLEPDIHIVDAISNKTDKEFTTQGESDARRGFVFHYTHVFEKQ